MGTAAHSKASRDRWKNISKSERKRRMKDLSNAGWGKLDKKARRNRALKGVQTKREKLLLAKQELHESSN